MTGCADGGQEPTDATGTTEAQSAGDPSRFDTDDIAELLRAEPGEFDAGEDADEIVDQLVSQFEGSDGQADDQEVFLELLNLAAADFREFQQYIDEFELEYSDITERPDGEVTAGADGAGLDVHVLFDASGSMADQLDGERKIDTATAAVRDFVDVATEADGARVSLRSYGNVEGDTCDSTEEVYPLGEIDEDRFDATLDAQEPGVNTPIALALEDALDDLDDAGQSVVYVVSDGMETCGGDPAAAAEALAESDAEAVVNIIGFDVSEDEQQALRDIAEAGNGDYHRADSGDELRRFVTEERNRLLTAWNEWQADNLGVNVEERNRMIEENEELVNESVERSRGEVDHLIDISNRLEQVDGETFSALELRQQARDRGLDVRNHVRSEFLDIRQSVRSEGLERRQDIRGEGLEERQRLRDENR